MELTAIDIEGFKSFAKKTHLSFKEGITAVIGPNGSGKSNVTEAIRWVLGEQSMKQLRGKESTDVIFHGAGDIPAARRARVTLTFSNESGKFPIEAAEIAITRTLSRDGESRYLINGDDVRLLDVQKMLAQAGVGARTFTVISQGMVDRYLTATETQRKELFDEATGIRSMQMQLQDAHRKLKKTKHHGEEIQSIIRELAPRLTVLGRQVKRYEQRDVLAREFEEKQLLWFSHMWHLYHGKLAKTEEHIAGLHEQSAAAKKRRQTLEHRLLRQHSSPSQEISAKLAQAEAQYATQKREYDARVAQKESLTTSLTEIQKKLVEADALLIQARKDSTRFDMVARAESVLTACTNFLQSFLQTKATTEEANTLLKSIQTYIKDLRATPATAATRNMVAQVEKPLQEVARLRAIEQERSEQLERLQIGVAPSTKEIESLQAQLQALSTTVEEEELPEKLETIREQELEAERAASTAAAASEQLRRDIAELEEEVLRERGSQALTELKNNPPLSAANIPSNEELRTIAGKLAAIGEPDPLVLKEYEEAKARHEHLSSQLADIQQAAANTVDLMGNLHKQMKQQFDERFRIIQKEFTQLFMQLFGGGKAAVVQTEEGIDISVTPPGKKSRLVTLLSGGERALTSLALLMAILKAQNPPFIVLDEVDAALDEANSQRFANLLASRGSTTQCIIVTHNRELMGVADMLYGVTMQQDGVSSVYSVELSDIESAEAAPQEPSFQV